MSMFRPLERLAVATEGRFSAPRYTQPMGKRQRSCSHHFHGTAHAECAAFVRSDPHSARCELLDRRRFKTQIEARMAIFELSKDGITRIAVTRLSTTSHQSITNEPTAPNTTFRPATNSRLKNPRRRPRRREK